MSSAELQLPMAAPESKEELWFVARGVVLKGPFTSSQLKEKLKTREISHWDYGWRQGFQEWRPLILCDEFDRRGRMKQLAPYPSLEVPGAIAIEQRIRKSAKKLRPITVVKKQSRYSISIYEWGAAAILCMLCSYVAVSISMNELSAKFLYRMDVNSLGLAHEVGSRETGELSREFLNPIYSAPGMTEDSEISIPTKVWAFPELGGSVGTKVLGFKMDSMTPLEISTVGEESWLLQEAAYTQPVEIHGRWHVQKSDSIQVRLPGSPEL